jgi:hypothetical protein
MRTQKRFTPSMLRRWTKLGRGTGILNDYQPWHQVTRGDPASRGRSTIESWQGCSAQLDVLSKDEQVIFFFCTMLPGALDIRPQFPLSLETNVHELAAYHHRFLQGSYPGSNEIAQRLNLKPTRVRNGDDEEPWRVTTDILTTCKDGRTDGYSIVAIASKPPEELLNKRKLERLGVEREYWLARNGDWLLITKELYREDVADTLHRTAVWALDRERTSEIRMQECASVVRRASGRTLTEVINAIQSALGTDQRHAQLALWQAVWKGLLPIDLRIGWRPNERIVVVDQETFRSFNPVASRRSAWMS